MIDLAIGAIAAKQASKAKTVTHESNEGCSASTAADPVAQEGV